MPSPFRHSAGFGRRIEYWVIGRMLKEGLDVYVPNINAFRDHAQKVYLASDEAKTWPAGMLDKINAMK